MSTLAAAQLQSRDFIVIVGYFALMLGIGIYFYRHMRSMSDFFTGGNRIPWWLAGVSFYMTSFSAFAFVAYSELAFKYGFVAVTLYWVTVPAVLIGAVWIAGRWRRARIVSPVEFLEQRYGLATRQTFAWANVPVRMVDNGLKLLAIGGIVSVGLGFGMAQSILLSGLIILAYTFMGGLWAVTVTDFLQFLVMITGVIILVPLSIAQLPDGLAALPSQTPDGFFSLTAPQRPWPFVLAFFAVMLLQYNSNFALVQRYYCVADEKAARKVGLLMTALSFLSPPIFFFPAMAARVFLPEAEPSTIYATLCVNLLPPGFLGLMMAAMFAATMSALSSEYNVMASVLTNDVYRRLIHPDATDHRLVWVGRLMTLLIGTVALILPLALVATNSDKGLFDKMVKLFGVAGTPIAVPMLAGLLWRRTTHAGALAGFSAGVVVGLVLFLCDVAFTPVALTTIAVTLIALIAVSLLTLPGPSEQLRREQFFDLLDKPVASDRQPATGTRRMMPLRVVGVSTALVGIMLLVILPGMAWGAGTQINLAAGMVLLVAGVMMATRRT